MSYASTSEDNDADDDDDADGGGNGCDNDGGEVKWVIFAARDPFSFAGGKSDGGGTRFDT